MGITTCWFRGEAVPSGWTKRDFEEGMPEMRKSRLERVMAAEPVIECVLGGGCPSFEYSFMNGYGCSLPLPCKYIDYKKKQPSLKSKGSATPEMCKEWVRFNYGAEEGEAKAMSDAVNKPSHYTAGSIEVIDFIEDQGFGYLLGNVVKYVSRAGRKSLVTEVEDLEKARWYLERRILERKRERDGK